MFIQKSSHIHLPLYPQKYPYWHRAGWVIHNLWMVVVLEDKELVFILLFYLCISECTKNTYVTDRKNVIANCWICTLFLNHDFCPSKCKNPAYLILIPAVHQIIKYLDRGSLCSCLGFLGVTYVTCHHISQNKHTKTRTKPNQPTNQTDKNQAIPKAKRVHFLSLFLNHLLRVEQA